MGFTNHDGKACDFVNFSTNLTNEKKLSLSEDWDLVIFYCRLGKKGYLLPLGMKPIFDPKYRQTRVPDYAAFHLGLHCLLK